MFAESTAYTFAVALFPTVTLDETFAKMNLTAPAATVMVSFADVTPGDAALIVRDPEVSSKYQNNVEVLPPEMTVEVICVPPLAAVKNAALTLPEFVERSTSVLLTETRFPNWSSLPTV